jgi:hypothetical protein
MARTFRPPVKRLDRLVARADRLTTWARVQAYLVRSSGPTKSPAPRPGRRS